MATIDAFLVSLCRRMGWEPTTWRLNVLRQMAQNEGNIDKVDQMWNPLSTTMPGGENPNFDIGYGAGNWNWNGGSPVKVYKDMATGVEQTARTLEGSYYPNLRKAMETQAPVPGVEQDLASWGWAPGTQASNAILSSMGGAAQGGGTMVTDPAQAALEAAAPRQQGTTAEGWMAFLKRKGFVTTYPDPQSGQMLEIPMENIPAAILEDLWAEYNGETAGGGMTAYEAGSLGLQQQQLGLQYAQMEQDRAYKAIEAMVDAGVWEPERAVSEWVNVQTAMQNRMGEAGARAQYVQGLLEERARKTTATPYFPGFEPGGLASQIMGRRGLTAPTLTGVPVETLPNPWETFRQGNVNVGLAPETPGIAPYPQAQNPYTDVLPIYQSMAGGGNPFAQFQATVNGQTGGTSVPISQPTTSVPIPQTADMRVYQQQGLTPEGMMGTINLRQILQQMGLVLPGLS